jgi:hypothetical protein
VTFPVTSELLEPPSIPTQTTSRRSAPPPIVWLKASVSFLVVAELAAPNVMAALALRGGISRTPSSRRAGMALASRSRRIGG